MSARYQIFHDTHYHYDSPVSLAQQLAHLWPRPCAWQRCSSQQLDISPEPTARRDELDVFGNPITRLAFERPHDELLVNAGLTVEVLARPALDFQQSPAWDQTRDSLTYSSQPLSAELIEACRYRFESPYVHLKKAFVEFSESCFPPGEPLLLGVQALMEKIFSEFTRCRSHSGRHAAGGSAGAPTRRVPGLRPPDASVPALAWPGSAVHQWLSAYAATARPATADRRRCVARVGFGVLPGVGLGRF